MPDLPEAMDPTVPSAPLPPLALRHRILADAYLLSGNKAQAAREANYSPEYATNIAARVLKRPEVVAYIARRRAEQEDEFGLSRDDVASQLRVVGLSSIDHYELTEDGELRVRQGAPPGAIGAVSRFKRKVRTTERTDKDGNVIVDKTVESEFALWPKNEALRLQAEILELTGKNAPSLADRLEAGVAIEQNGAGEPQQTKVLVLVRVRKE